MTAPALVSSNTTVATMKMQELDAHVSPLQIHVQIHILHRCDVKYILLTQPPFMGSFNDYVRMYNIHMCICTYIICMS